jgi:hypothetical protein
MKYKFEDLPTPVEIFGQTKKLRNCTLDEANLVREKIFDDVEMFKGVITDYFLKNEWVDEPDTFSNRLLNLHQLNCSFIGLAEGLHDRLIYLIYKQLTEQPTDPTSKKGLAAGDRKVYAEGEVSDLAGLVKDLDQTQKNLWERVNSLKYKR